MKKQSSEFISSTFERKEFDVKFINASLYLNIKNVLHVFFTFQCVIPGLSLVFREFIVGIFPLHTHTHACTHKHILIFICYGTGLQLPALFLTQIISRQQKNANTKVA